MALDFIPSKGKHTGKDIANFFYDSLKKIRILRKIQGITADNASVNTTFMEKLENKFSKSGTLTFDAEDQHFRCFCHIINLAVQDVLSVLKLDNFKDDADREEDADQQDDAAEKDDTDGGNDAENVDFGDGDDVEEDDADSGNKDITGMDSTEFDADIEKSSDDENELIEDNIGMLPIVKLRNICKKFKASEKLTLTFQKFCQAFNETFKQLPFDICTRWNSTHHMLPVTLKMKNSSSAFCLQDKKLKIFYITDEEWYLFKLIEKYLRIFKQLSDSLAGDQYATLPSVVIGVNIIIDSIEALCHHLDNKPNRTAVDQRVIFAFNAGRQIIEAL